MTNKEIYDKLRVIRAQIISDRIALVGLKKNDDRDLEFGQGINDLGYFMLDLIKE